jgi:periplasmic glucans biosynthesis protein
MTMNDSRLASRLLASVGSLLRAATVAVLALVGSAAQAQGFDFDGVDKVAKALAAKPYNRSTPPLPKALKELNYDQMRDIRFDPARSLWRAEKLPFELQFFHLGGQFHDHPVRINEVVDGVVREIPFDPADFDYGKTGLDRAQMRKLGFAGFRIHAALNTQRYKDELLVFLGASYFRALGQGQRFGASARGLAVDTAERAGEEFPRFEQFWIVRPVRNARELTVYALLDSRRVTGAYRFIVRPGGETVTEVTARLHLRETGAKIGLAPLTSMFFHGENQRATAEDFRPEVHDSDGLSIQAANGEWNWRPLVNPRRLLVTSFAVTDPRGFGLVQRDRSFGSYEDLEARYELRPSVWVEPVGSWGAGRVELVQIPTPDETNDNIVAYWVPQQTLRPGQPFEFRYRLMWQKGTERRPPSAWVVQTRRGQGYAAQPDDVVKLTVDFDGPALRKLPADAAVTADLSVNGGQQLALNVHRNEVSGGWRMVVQVRRAEKDKPVELRAVLRNADSPLSETWSYIIPAN